MGILGVALHFFLLLALLLQAGLTHGLGITLLRGFLCGLLQFLASLIQLLGSLGKLLLCFLIGSCSFSSLLGSFFQGLFGLIQLLASVCFCFICLFSDLRNVLLGQFLGSLGNLLG